MLICLEQTIYLGAWPAAKEGVGELAYLALGVAAVLAHDPPLSHKSSREDSES